MGVRLLRESMHGDCVRKPSGQLEGFRFLFERLFHLIQQPAAAMGRIDGGLAKFRDWATLVSLQGAMPDNFSVRGDRHY